jgi:hypothetical protein
MCKDSIELATMANFLAQDREDLEIFAILKKEYTVIRTTNKKSHKAGKDKMNRCGAFMYSFGEWINIC